jgi:hypothetical protein
MLTELARQAIQHVGLQGVSAGVMALLVAVALYTHKAASTGQRVVHVGSTATHDLKVVAIVLAVLLALGVLEGVDTQRVQELGRQLGAIDWGHWFERVSSWVA